jgi:hypothetical protein
VTQLWKAVQYDDVPAAATNVAALELLVFQLMTIARPTLTWWLPILMFLQELARLMVTRTYTVTDASGNSSSVNHIIYIDDTTVPTWVTTGRRSEPYSGMQ